MPAPSGLTAAEAAALRRELDTLKKQLAAANKENAELRRELALAKPQPSEQQPSRRVSVAVPEWLQHSGNVAQSMSVPDDPLQQQPPDEMPAWLRTASEEVAVQPASDSGAAQEQQQHASPNGTAASTTTSMILAASASFGRIPDATPLSLRIVAHALVKEHSKEHVEHALSVTLDTRTWTVHRRYKEFVQLHAALAPSLQLKGPLPVPKLVLHTPGALGQREKRLVEYLETCVTKARARREPLPPLERFLGLSSFAAGASGSSSAESAAAAAGAAATSLPDVALAPPPAMAAAAAGPSGTSSGGTCAVEVLPSSSPSSGAAAGKTGSRAKGGEGCLVS